MQSIQVQNIQDRPLIDEIAPQDFLLIGDASSGYQVKRVLVSTLTAYVISQVPTPTPSPSPSPSPSPTPTPTSSQSIFSSEVTPDNVDVFATANRTFGTKFKSTVAGVITGIRFYKDPNETGSQIGGIWLGEDLLASVEFPDTLPNGWIVQNLTTPLSILADTFYMVEVSVNAKYGRKFYEATEITSSNLIAEVRGYYGWSSSLPVQQEGGIRNYLRDVVFVPS